MLSRGRAIPIPVQIQCHPIKHFCKRCVVPGDPADGGYGPWNPYYLGHRIFIVLLTEAGRGWLGPFGIRKRTFRDSSERRDGSERVPIACVFVNACVTRGGG